MHASKAQGDCIEMFRYEHHKNIGHDKEVLILTVLADDFKLFPELKPQRQFSINS